MPYDRKAVDKAIAASNRSGRPKIGAREASAIHRLLEGRCSAPSREQALETALFDLLNYVGGWDVEDPEHPIVKARQLLPANLGGPKP